MASINTKEKTNVIQGVQALNVHFSDKKYTLLRTCHPWKLEYVHPF
jgi:hypothetical protein